MSDPKTDPDPERAAENLVTGFFSSLALLLRIHSGETIASGEVMHHRDRCIHGIEEALRFLRGRQ